MRRLSTRLGPATAAGALLSLATFACSPAPPPEPAPSRPIRVAIYDDPLNLDPHGNDEYLTFSVLLNFYESLTAFDRELRVEPALAAGWENPSDLVWRFNLRPGVRFHDGTPLTAADVVFSIERAKRHRSGDIAPYLIGVSEVRAIDEGTVELTTQRPYPVLLNKLTHVLIVPEGSPDTIEEPIGTGPYRMVSYEPGKVMELQGFEGHWLGPPREPEVLLLPIGDADRRLEMLIGGDVDFVLELSPSHVASVSAAPGSRVESQESLAIDYLLMSLDEPPFDDLRVRRAVHLAIDRQALVDEMLLGQGRPASQMVSRQVFGYAPQLEAPDRDLDAARRLLTEAGYPDGIGVELAFRSTRPAQAIVDQLADAGIAVTPKPEAWEELFPRLRAGEVDFYYGAYIAASADASDLFDSKVHTRDQQSGYGGTNFGRYSNPDLDDLIEASGVTFHMRTRRETLQRSMELLMEDLPLIPLFVAFQLHGIRDDVAWDRRLDARVLAADLERRDGSRP